MSSQFLNILRQSFKTFDRSNTANFTANIQCLKNLTDSLSYRDLFINQSIFQESTFQRPGRAPCVFIHIFENDLVSLSVFILRGGFTMPLHDHPMMNGILKCLYGQLLVQSYTFNSSTEELLSLDKTSADIPVTQEEPRLVGPDSECAMLSPHERNFHEITALNGVAAFFDILSPPYDANIPVYGRRRCQFYSPIIDTLRLKPMTSLKLQRIPSPLSYYCDVAETPVAVQQCAILCAAEGQAKENQ